MLQFHHLGVAVPDIAKALPGFVELFEYRVTSGPFEDPVQRVAVCFLEDAAGMVVELVAPLGADSPIHNTLKKGQSAYHICYETDAMDEAIRHLRAGKCALLAAPVPAVAFEGRRIAWLMTPSYVLVELVEALKNDRGWQTQG